MADDAAAAIREASAGLLYPSESDAPFDPVRWDPAKGEPTPEAVAGLGAKGKGKRRARPATEVPAGEFFAALAETDDAAEFRRLEGVLRNSLADLKVFRVGSSGKVDIYVLGRAPSGEWLGLHTTSVET
jgi:Nuclease A inhibitor-like protein